MQNNFLEAQFKLAEENYNYFIMRMIIKVLQVCFKLSIALLISQILNYTIINIIILIYTLFSLYKIYYITNYYNNIINDIKETLNTKELSLVIDLEYISDDLIKGITYYGKKFLRRYSKS